jgi:hypothetical protein
LYINFLSVIEEDNVISGMSWLPSASTPEEIIDAGHSLVEPIFGKNIVAKYTLTYVW